MIDSVGYKCAVFEHKGSLFYTNSEVVLRVGDTGLGLARSPRPGKFKAFWNASFRAEPVQPGISKIEQSSLGKVVTVGRFSFQLRYVLAVRSMYPAAIAAIGFATSVLTPVLFANTPLGPVAMIAAVVWDDVETPT